MAKKKQVKKWAWSALVEGLQPDPGRGRQGPDRDEGEGPD